MKRVEFKIKFNTKKIRKVKAYEFGHGLYIHKPYNNKSPATWLISMKYGYVICGLKCSLKEVKRVAEAISIYNWEDKNFYQKKNYQAIREMIWTHAKNIIVLG